MMACVHVLNTTHASLFTFVEESVQSIAAQQQQRQQRRVAICEIFMYARQNRCVCAVSGVQRLYAVYAFVFTSRDAHAPSTQAV